MPESFYEDKDKMQKKLTLYLTQKMINRLQNYYGIAIRSSCTTSVPVMRKAVRAVLFQCSEAVDSAGRHQFCPPSPTSWCKYMVDQVKGTTDYVEKPGLSIPLRKKLEPIFRELSSPELLAISACCMDKPKIIMNPSMGLSGSVAQRIYMLVARNWKCPYRQQLLVLIPESGDYSMFAIIVT